MLDNKFFLKVGPKVRDRYRKHIFEDAKDVYDKKFKTYEEPYGSRKRANKFKRQASKYANTTAPVLTTDLLRHFRLIRTSENGFQFGFITRGSVVQSLNKRGRVLSAKIQPLPQSTINYILEEAKKFTDKKLKTIIPKSKTIKVGKK